MLALGFFFKDDARAQTNFLHLGLIFFKFKHRINGSRNNDPQGHKDGDEVPCDIPVMLWKIVTVLMASLT